MVIDNWFCRSTIQFTQSYWASNNYIAMDPKLLTENGWKSLALRFRIKDNRLQDALWAYEQVDEQHYDTRLKMVAGLSHLAWVLKNTKEIGGIRPVGRYLDDLVSAADAKHRELASTKAVA